MQTLKEQQAKAWRLAPEGERYIAQDADGSWRYYCGRPVYNPDFPRWLNYGVRTFKGQINGWDWRDTLQTREEWEAMKPSELDKAKGKYEDEKWMPEVGQSFERLNPDTGNWEDGYVLADGDLMLLVVIRSREQAVRKSSEFRPIQTQADKYREEQIEKLRATVTSFYPGVGGAYITKKSAEMYNKGVRVLAPDEFVAKRLTDEQKYALLIKPTTYEMLIDAVQSAIFGER